MSDVRLLFDKTAIVKRNKPISGTSRVRLSATATAEANIQQLDAETTQRIAGVFGESYILYCDPELDIREGDRVVCKETSESFKVTEVIKAEMMGIEHFKQVYITKLNED
jgi:hypothetical protein